jgi:flagellin
MSSINTNVSAMTALQTLTATNKSLSETQNRIATGMRVATAADNAAYWSIATGMRTQNGGLSAVRDALGLGAAIVDTAYSALNDAIGIAQKIFDKYVARETPGTDTTIIDAEITELKAQVVGFATGATFEGVNLLATGGADQDVVTGYESGTGVTTMTVAAYDLEAALAAANDSVAVETAIEAMRAAAAGLGSAKTRIDAQQTFTSSLMDALDRGIGQLVDADMNKESARLSALQVKQQLGIQALSIANSNTQSILSLFR